MRVETERSRNDYREYSDRKYDNRFKRKNYRNDNHPYHSSRISLKSHHHHHHYNDYLSNRVGNNQPSSFTEHRFDRQMNNRDVYPTLSTDLSDGPPPQNEVYYNSSQSTRDRGLPSHYIDSERSRYSQPSSSIYRRESSPPLSSYRNDVLYQSPTNVSIRSSIDPYDDVYRTSDYPNRSERYDVSQNRNGSITSQSSPVYRSSSTYVTHDQYIPIREVDYRTATTTSMDYHHSSYRDRPRSNFNDNGSKRSMRR